MSLGWIRVSQLESQHQRIIRTSIKSRESKQTKIPSDDLVPHFQPSLPQMVHRSYLQAERASPLSSVLKTVRQGSYDCNTAHTPVLKALVT